ncbi:MAG: aminoacyl-tRNA hydrolase [Bacteroidia bacterium]|nr:aminoacyl-tRNA hydrolase [Bacteroidia bacterium]
MKFLIVGLGNIGEKYHETRHNIGFMVLDHMAASQDLLFATERYGDIATLKHKGRQLVMLKPSTYMNLSGKALRYHMDHHKVPIERVLVITDDLALPFGKLRLKGKGSDGGHNGLKNIQEVIGTQAYARMRIGIGSEFQAGQQVDYVLNPFSVEERSSLKPILEACAAGVLDFSTIGLERTMNHFNKR